MPFNKFKNEIKAMSLKQLQEELRKRKEELLKWNLPRERQLEVAGVSGRNQLRYFTKHPHRKVKKEIAILNFKISQLK